MGTCCTAHLATKIREHAKNAQNGAVTVTVIENPEVRHKHIEHTIETIPIGICDYCRAPAEFTCSYYPK